MKPEDQRKLDMAVQTISDILRCESVPFQQSVVRRITDKLYLKTGEITVASTSDVNEAVAAVPATVARDFDHKVQVTIDGTNYYIGLYNI